jgi:magnesium transporter
MSAALIATEGSPPEGNATELAVAPSACEMISDQGSAVIAFDREAVESLLASGNFFWLDLGRPTADDFSILREVFKFHLLALEDSEQFNQRAKIDGYDDFVFIVVYGAGPGDDRLVEVHCFYSERFLITVHREDCPAFAEIRRRYRKRERAIDHPSLLLYRVVDGLVDSFFPSLAELDDRIDELEDAIFLKADESPLQEIFQMKRQLVGMRKTVPPQRDAFASLMGGVAELPGLAEEDEHYFRDVYDHLIRISDLIDSYRDLLTGAMDVYLSTVSNRNQRGDEATDDHRHHLSAADFHHRLLRPELRLDGFPRPQRAHVPRPRHWHRDRRPPRAPRILQTPRLVLRPGKIEEVRVRSSQRRRR